MKKVLLLTSIFAISFFSSFSQFKIGFTGSVLAPLAHLSDSLNGDVNAVPQGSYSLNPGFGGSLHGRYAFNKYVQVGLNIGAYKFGGTSVSAIPSDNSTYASLSMISGSASVEGFLPFGLFKPYIGLDLGSNYVTTSVPYNSTTVGDQTYVTPPHSYSAFAPATAQTIGFYYSLTDYLDFNLNLKYNSFLLYKHLDSYVSLNMGLMITFPGQEKK